MDHKWKVRHIALAALIATGTIQGVHAQASSDSNTAGEAQEDATATVASAPPATATDPAPVVLTPAEASQSAAGNVAELQRMIGDSEVIEFRTTSNGSYGASLLFYKKEMTFYVALFRQKNLWRVVKTQDDTRAELIYKDFVRQTTELSAVDIRRIRLEAQNAFTERMIALSQDHVNRLQADLTVARQEQSIVAVEQKRSRDAAGELQTQKAAAQDQLRATQRQVSKLQRQLDSGLPGSAAPR